MKIDKETYKLGEDNYVHLVSRKQRIVFGNTFSNDMNHFIGWNKRWFGNYTKTATYTISVSGEIYEHFSPEYYSNFLNDIEISEGTISILLENEGWLMKDLFEKNLYINYVGDIYKREDTVLDKKWRKYRFWAPYTKKQLESASNLVKKLCDEFDIPLKVVAHNTNFDEVKYFHGILYKSNFEKFYTDVSPAWDFKKFKNKVEKDEKND